MKVIDHIKKSTSPLISFEITPPKRGGDINDILYVVDKLKEYNPSFIHVTSRAAEIEYEETLEGGFKRKVKRKRPGTSGVCTRIQYEYKIDTVCHILCSGFTQQETEDFLIDLNYIGIKNLFAIKGDDTFKKPLNRNKSVNKYAIDLVKQVNKLNKGNYLEQLLDVKSTDFCIGVAGYPEKHYTSPNIEMDIEYLKQKIDGGAEYVITQMFFDNEKYFRFVDMCNKKGIEAPIIPGLSVLNFKNQLNTLPKRFYIDLPYELSKQVSRADKKDVVNIGIDWTINQAQQLIEQKVPGIHFFIYENFESILKVLENLKKN